MPAPYSEAISSVEVLLLGPDYRELLTGSNAGAYGSTHTLRSMLGGLYDAIWVQQPGPHEQIDILAAQFPLLRALLPTALGMLCLVGRFVGQDALGTGAKVPGADIHASSTEQPHLSVENSQQAGWLQLDGLLATVEAAIAAAGIYPGAAASHIGRHFSLRDLLKWAARMEVCNYVELAWHGSIDVLQCLVHILSADVCIARQALHLPVCG